MIFHKKGVREALKFWVSATADSCGEELDPEIFADHVENGLRVEGFRLGPDTRRGIINLRQALFNVRRKCPSKD